jgi:hypothetical protein
MKIQRIITVKDLTVYSKEELIQIVKAYQDALLEIAEKLKSIAGDNDE